jgi:hypothetical protein
VGFPITLEASVANPLGAYLSMAVELAGHECPSTPEDLFFALHPHRPAPLARALVLVQADLGRRGAAGQATGR